MFTGLGLWQLERLAWKTELIATVDARVHADPVPVPPEESWKDLDVDELVYRRVTATGVLDHDAEAQSLAVTELGPGYWAMTPLRLDDGGTVMINRGFVPQDLRDPRSRSTSSPAVSPGGRVGITGLLRASEPGGGFLRDNDPVAGRWYSRDTRAMAHARHVPGPIAPFFVDAEATPSAAADSARATAGSSEVWPRGGLTVIDFRNTHLAYALTWFALAAMSIFGIHLVRRHPP